MKKSTAEPRLRNLAIAGVVMLSLGLLGLGWRRVTEQERGLLGSMLFFLLAPPGAMLTVVAAALFLFRRVRRPKGSGV